MTGTGALWHAAGHDVTFAARDITEAQVLAEELGDHAHAAAMEAAAACAEVVLAERAFSTLQARVLASQNHRRPRWALFRSRGPDGHLGGG